MIVFLGCTSAKKYHHHRSLQLIASCLQTFKFPSRTPTTTTITRTITRTTRSHSHSPYHYHYHHRHRNCSTNNCRRLYFTNGRETKNNDPYAILGLQWGDGATSTEIKAAFRSKARELHPDVNTKDTPQQALDKFQKLQRAYESLMMAAGGNNDLDFADLEEWRVAVFRRAERLALDRTDVAGTRRKRPIPPANSKVYSKEIGHPQGGGVASRGEYVTAGGGTADQDQRIIRKSSSSVGSGRNKWVKPKEFKPWDGSGKKGTAEK